MAALLLEIDAASENAANTPLTVNDQLTRWLMPGTEFPPPEEKVQWASSVDSEGAVPIAGAHENRAGQKVILRVHGTDANDVEQQVAAFSQKAEKCRRQGGTLKATLPSGNSYVLDVLAGGIATNFVEKRYLVNNRAEITWTFTAKPYWRGEEIGPITDDFSSDTITAGDWTFGTGSGTLSVSGGQLVPSSTAVKRIYRTGVSWYDPRVTFKYTTDNPLTNPGTLNTGVLLKRIDASNYLYGVRLSDSSLRVRAVIAGVSTDLATQGGSALAAATSYWIRGKIDGNDVTIEHWTTDPAVAGNTPAQSLTHTLTSTNATTFGEGVAGNVGMHVAPGSTSWRYDDLIIEPWSRSERTLPHLVFKVRGVPGDVPALGRLEVINDSAADWWFLMWGLQSRFYSSAATAKLFYEAEDLTPLGTAAVSSTLNSTASGAGTNDTVLAGDLTTTYQAILSTQATGGGAHLSHVGDYRVWARVQCPAGNTGDVKLALEWGEGDFRRFTRNADWSMSSEWEGSWRLADLGLVHLSEVAQGTQRWEGRVLGKSTVAGDDVHVDCLFLMPVAEGYGEVRAVMSAEQSPTSFNARDEFDQAAGNLNGKTLPVGGTWATAGSTTDLAVTSGHTVERSTTSDAGSRRAIASLAAHTAQTVQVDFKLSALVATNDQLSGVIARYVDSSNFVVASGRLPGYVSVAGQVAGAPVSLGGPVAFGGAAINTWYTVRLQVHTDGHWFAWFFRRGAAPGAPVLGGYSSHFAPGGALASGQVGIYDWSPSATACTRTYDNFAAWTPAVDAAIFAGQSLEIRHDSVIREDATGAFWNTVSSYQGRYLHIPVAGQEDRATRLVVKPSRNDPDYGADESIDDLTARLTVTPRYLSPGE